MNSNNEFAQQNFNIKNKEDYRVNGNKSNGAPNNDNSQGITRGGNTKKNNNNNDGTIGPDEE